jgi:hypothetical protein
MKILPIKIIKGILMDKTLFNFLLSNKRLVGAVAIVICIATWALELSALVYVCPYCRAQRTVIGILGLFLLLSNTRHWISLYLSSAIAAFGFIVATDQHFSHWKKIMAGSFEWGSHWYMHPWLLSGCALLLISALILLIWARPPAQMNTNDSE